MKHFIYIFILFIFLIPNTSKANINDLNYKLLEIEQIASKSLPYIPIWISSQKAWSQNYISKPIFNGAGIINMSDLKYK